MKQIIETLDKILKLSKEYDSQLAEIKNVFLTVPLSTQKNVSDESKLKHQSQAFNLLSSYVGNQISAINNFVQNWDIEKRVKYLINYDSHSLTNGKFYDFAVGHEMWRMKREDIYQLIQGKIQKYVELSLELKERFREYVANNYKETLKYYPSEIVKIIEDEVSYGNEIIETSADEYFKYKVFLKLRYKFRMNYKDKFSKIEYRHLNDVHYWNEEYKDYFFVLACGFDKLK
jgi:hypothetical protein